MSEICGVVFVGLIILFLELLEFEFELFFRFFFRGLDV